MIQNKKHRRWFIVVGIIFISIIILAITVFLPESYNLSKEEEIGLQQILGKEFSEKESKNLSEEILTKEIHKKYPDVKKVFEAAHGNYAFICEPIGYNGPITIAVVIDSKKEEVMGIRIVEHMETKEYVRDMESNWFTDRFIGKSISKKLKVNPLEAISDHDIITITGATVSTQGVVDGVNSTMEVYKKYVENHNSQNNANKKEEKYVENGTLNIKCEEKLLGTITLDAIKKMPSVKRRITIHSSQGDTKHDFRGVLLSDVLNSLSPDFTSKYKSAIVKGADEYEAEIDMTEILDENKVYLVYADGEKPLLTQNNEPMSMRIIVLGDDYGQRFTNYLIEINLK